MTIPILPTALLAPNVLAAVLRLCADSTLEFQEKCKHLEERMALCSREQIIEHLRYGGIIAECIEHDSSEEKLLAKYCDILLARALHHLGFSSRVLAERGDAADVYAELNEQKLVGDGKIFRLSRTALNPKDYKVASLSKWRTGLGFVASYSVLLAPSFQYPLSKSQLYAQAIEHGVLLLSFEQLAFLVTYPRSDRDYTRLWAYPSTLTHLPPADRKSATAYWHGLDTLVAELTAQPLPSLLALYQERERLLLDQFAHEIAHWANEEVRIRALSQQQAITELLEARKILARIGMMTKARDEIASKFDDIHG